MADVQEAFLFVMTNEDPELEGEVTQEPENGLARFGVNSIAHPEAMSDGFYHMDRDEALRYARGIFVKDYWDKIEGDKIRNQETANKWVDLVYNVGVENGVKIMQRGINSMFAEQVILVDGIVGEKTMTKVNSVDNEDLRVSLRGYAIYYYEDIIFNKPELAKYKDGWLTRLDV